MGKFIIYIALITLSLSVMTARADETFTSRPDVQAFIDKMVKNYHFDKADLTKMMDDVKIRPQVRIHLNKPLEIEPWRTYQMLFVNEWRIQHGVEFWKKNEKWLKKAQEVYGVPAGIIVATLGIETKYGEKMGDYRLIDSLSSLGFSDSPRADYFKNELAQFLLLTREQHMDPLKIQGSYAGAIGQPQFMPTSYRYYAVNFSGTDQADLINNTADAIASVGNYYHKLGWKTGQPIAQPALTIGNRYNYLVKKHQMKTTFTARELGKYGIIPKTKIERHDLPLKVVELPSRFNKEYWITYRNFTVIKRYNSSDLYAMAVFQLSKYITTLKERLDDGKHP